MRVGDTITDKKRPAGEALPGYREVTEPMVFSGLFPIDADEYAELRDALEKLSSTTRRFTYEPETRSALGFGFRAAFWACCTWRSCRAPGARVRPRADHDGAPRCVYLTNGDDDVVDNPAKMPGRHRPVEEPFVTASILVPTDYVGAIMELCQGRRGDFVDMKYLSPRARRDALRVAAGRDRARLLRQAEVEHARLRLARLRVLRLPGATSSSSTSCSTASRSTPSR